MSQVATEAEQANDDQSPDISLLIPTLNEEEGIEECIRRARQGFEELGLSGEIIVSDSSTDRTPEIAEELGARVIRPDTSGYGYAYLYAFEHARGDIIAMGDGDTTYDFTELPRLVAEIEDGADLVVGSRFDGEMEPGAMPWLHRHVGNPLLTKFLNVFYRMDISDAHGGFRVFTREAFEAMRPGTEGMEFASEMLIRAKAKGLDIREVPISYRSREGDATLESFSDGWRHVRFMIANAPGEVFLLPGVFFLCLGTLLMGITYFDLPPFQVLSTNSMTAGSLLTLLGSQVVGLGVFSTRARNPIRTPPQLPENIGSLLKIERGITGGIALTLLGGGYALYLLQRWAVTGFDVIPRPADGILAMTLITLGLQTVFQMIFISLLEDLESYE